MRFYRSASITVSTRNLTAARYERAAALKTSHIEYGPGMKRAGNRSSRIFAGACITDLLPEAFQTTRVLSLTQRPDLLRRSRHLCLHHRFVCEHAVGQPFHIPEHRESTGARCVLKRLRSAHCNAIAKIVQTFGTADVGHKQRVEGSALNGR